MAEAESQRSETKHIGQPQQLERLFLQPPDDNKLYVRPLLPGNSNKFIPFEEVGVARVCMLAGYTIIQPTQTRMYDDYTLIRERQIKQPVDVGLTAATSNEIWN